MIKYELFPKIEEVFTNVTDDHHAVFFPLLTIDLESINKGKGKVHFISYFRDGEPDDISDPNFSYNFMRFQVVENKYQFNGDFKKIYLFEKSVVWYQEALEIYAQHKDKYLTKSDFVKQEDDKRMAIDFEYYYYIKGVLNYWVTRDKYLETNKFIQGSAYTNGNSNHERKPFKDLGDYEDHGYVDEILEETEILIKYESYIIKEQELANRISKHENVFLKDDIDYMNIIAISYEAREKLLKIKPASIGQASRISGVSPADISVLLVYIGK